MCTNVSIMPACLPACPSAQETGVLPAAMVSRKGKQTHRERLQAGIRELQAEMRRLASELGPLRLEGPGRERAAVRASAPPAEATSGSRLWGC